MKKIFGIFALSIVLLIIGVFTKPILAEDSETKKSTSGEVAQHIKKLQIPFIANEGQVDEKVMYYANTFGGTVFITKDGEIVYSMPKGSKAESAESRVESSDVETQCLASLMPSPDQIQQRRDEPRASEMIHDAGCKIQDNPESCIVDRASYNQSAIQNPKSEIQGIVLKETLIDSKVKPCRLGEAERTQQINDSQPPTSNTFLQGVALKETLVGAKVKEIKGEGTSVTKVNYFRGNDQKKWKSNISTYDMVNLGEVYNGIELKLKAHGNNVEKLFHVKPGADPDQIKINLSGVKDCGVQNAGCGIENPKLSVNEQGHPCRLGEAERTQQNNITKGASGLWVNEQGQLVAETELGPVTFTKPVAYQEIDGKRVNVDVEYTISYSMPSFRAESRNQSHQWYNSIKDAGYWIHDNHESYVTDHASDSDSQTHNSSTPQLSNSCTPQLINSGLTYGFAVASYDETKELVIDPLLASAFLGGSDSDTGYSIAIDASGYVYVTGSTSSSDFPTISGAYNNFYNNYDDIFIAKLSSDMNSLLAATYLGGSSNDNAYSLAIDTNGYIYITGNTYSTDFPTTTRAYDTSYSNTDSYVSKLSSDLDSLLASTYLGGSSYEIAYSLAVDTNGYIYVTGGTYSTDFPTTTDVYDTTGDNNTSYYDVFVSKLSNNLENLIASTYLSGSNSDSARSAALDLEGNIYVVGYTNSSDFPTTGVYDTSFNSYSDSYSSSPSNDVFISKLNDTLTNLLASTYVGGYSDDKGYSITIDSEGNIYVTGETNSSEFPTTIGAYDTSYNGYDTDAFVSKFNGSLTTLIASTYLGGASSYDYGEAITLGTKGDIYLVGHTYSSNFPITDDPYRGYMDGNSEAFISKLNTDLENLLASTYLGGDGHDWARDIAIDSNGNIYVTGQTESSNFPTTTTAFGRSFGGGSDTFVSKLDNFLSGPSPTGSISINEDNSYTNSTTVTLNLSAYDSGSINGYFLSTDSYTPSTTDNGWIYTNSTKNFSDNVSYSINGEDGNKVIYVWYKDVTDIVSDGYSDSIILDTTSPQITIINPTSNDTYTTTTNTISIEGSAIDTTSGIKEIRWENDTGENGIASGTMNWSIDSLSLYSGENLITITATDNAGNSEIDIITIVYKQGKIFGNVMDEKGKYVESATIKCKGRETGVKQNSYSDKNGYFEFTDLHEDRYKIVARKKGYNKAKISITLEEGEEKEIELVIKNK